MCELEISRMVLHRAMNRKEPYENILDASRKMDDKIMDVMRLRKEQMMMCKEPDKR